MLVIIDSSYTNIIQRENMKDIDQISDKLLLEIMQIEDEINKIMALNGNKENPVTQQYRKFIQTKVNKLNQINHHYRDILDDNN